MITTACVLHNFILLNNAASSDIGDLLEPGDASDVVMPLVGNANEDIAGKMKRDVIAGLLHGGPAN